MKSRLLVMISVLSFCMFFTSCSDKKIDSSHTTSAVESTINSSSTASETSSEASSISDTTQSSTIANTYESINTPTPEPKTVEAIEAKDYSVSDGTSIITLDSPYKDFKVNYDEKKIDNSYVGETTSGDAIYKNYMHKFDDFDIYVSNAYYDTKNRNFDEYYVTQITLNTPNFMTARGITVGASLDEVMNLYGEGNKVERDGNVSLSNRFDDMELSFANDKDQIVRIIILSIVVE